MAVVMTEDMIERVFEGLVDGLDRRFLSTSMPKDEYDERYAGFKAWADEQHALRRAAS